MTGAGSARSSDFPPPNPAKVSPICCTSDGPKTGPRDPRCFQRETCGAPWSLHAGRSKRGGTHAHLACNFPINVTVLSHQ
jgi:hypothetical protein